MATQAEIYAEKLRSLISSEYTRVGVAEASVRTKIQQALDSLRTRLIKIPVGSFSVAEVRQVMAGLERSFGGLTTDLSSDYVTLIDDTVREGIEKILGPMRSVGFNGLPPVQISQNLINASTRFTADLIQLDSAKALLQIEEVLTQSALLAQTPGAAISAIGNILPNAGPFGSLTSRATTIYRTESLRMYSVVSEQQLQATGRIIPGMQKSWLHTGIGVLQPRSIHVAFSGTTVKLNELFSLPLREGGMAQIPYPRHPSLPAADAANCACTVEERFPSQAESAQLGLDNPDTFMASTPLG